MMPPKYDKAKYVQQPGTLVVTSCDGKERFTLFYAQNPAFSNFYCCQFEINGIVFQSTEQYFHYMKAFYFEDELSMKRILEAQTCFEQKKLGRLVKNFDQNKWEQACEKFMKEGNMAKYTQNSQLREALFQTVGTTLVEASPTDCKWGIGLGIENCKVADRRNWRGQNLLGRILTEIREELMKRPEYAKEIQLVEQFDQ